MTKGVSTSH